jgi:hypothetical protein
MTTRQVYDSITLELQAHEYCSIPYGLTKRRGGEGKKKRRRIGTFNGTIEFNNAKAGK